MADRPQTLTKPNTDGDPPKPKGYTAAKVFSTPELMEGILLNLSTSQLFGVLRTCKTFNDTIDGSVKLQRAMFLQLDPSVTFDPYDPELNPLFEELFFIPSHDLVKKGAGGVQFREAQPEWAFVEGEPRRKQELTLVFEADSHWRMEGKATKIYKYHTVMVEKKGKKAKKKNVRVEQSWRRTLIAQGVPDEFEATIDVDHVLLENFGEPINSMDWRSTNKARKWEDVTLGQVVDSFNDKLYEEFREQALEQDEDDSAAEW